jgi:hypothetical protein
LARFDTNTETWVAVYQLGAQCSYGIAVDAHNRIWRGGWPQCAGVMMFDPATIRVWTFTVPDTVPNPPPFGGTSAATVTAGVYPIGNGAFFVTGVGVEPATGDVWMSFYPIGYTGRLRVNEDDFSQSTMTYIGSLRNADNSRVATATGFDLRGIGFDRNGFGWTLGLGSTHVYKLDPATNGRGASMPSGRPIGVGTHYTYSDFTGSTALSFTAPRGFWRYKFTAEFDDAQVDAILWDAFVPMETSAGIRIRAVASDGTPLSGWLPPDDLGVPNYFEYPSGVPTQRIDLASNGGPLVGPQFEVEVRLTTTDRDIRPVVNDVQLEWQRP